VGLRWLIRGGAGNEIVDADCGAGFRGCKHRAALVVPHYCDCKAFGGLSWSICGDTDVIANGKFVAGSENINC
jgi:hypothetical protein